MFDSVSKIGYVIISKLSVHMSTLTTLPNNSINVYLVCNIIDNVTDFGKHYTFNVILYARDKCQIFIIVHKLETKFILLTLTRAI